MTRATRIVLGLAAWSGFLITAGTVGGIHNGSLAASDLISGVVVVGVGLFLAHRVPSNPVGWLIAGSGVFWAWNYLGNSWSIAQWLSIFPESVVVAFVWSGNWLWVVGFIALLFTLLLFPNGALPSRRWRPVAWTGVVGGGLTAIGAAFGPFDAELELSNPLEIANADLLLIAGGGVVVLFAASAVASLFVRYRSADSVERAQLRWLGFASAAALGLWLAGGVLVLIPGVSWAVLNLLILTAIPIAITVAVTRYHLYDIDKIVGRTVTYTIVVGGLALVFTAGAVWLPQQLPTANNNLLVAASTLAVAALFNPVRRRVQRTVDRRFNRLPYDPEAVGRTVEVDLREAVDAVAVGNTLNRAAAEALEPRTSAVWVRNR